MRNVLVLMVDTYFSASNGPQEIYNKILHPIALAFSREVTLLLQYLMDIAIVHRQNVAHLKRAKDLIVAPDFHLAHNQVRSLELRSHF